MQNPRPLNLPPRSVREGDFTSMSPNSKKKIYQFLCTLLYPYILILLLISACTPQLPNASDITPVTAIPAESDVILCAIGQDNSLEWDVRLDALIQVHERFGDCDTNIDLLLYNTYSALGQLMEAGGDSQAAITFYENALFYYPEGFQAQNRLNEIQEFEVTEAVTVCGADISGEDLPDYQTTDSDFAELSEAGFQINGADYPIYGVNYYPKETPFGLFLTESKLEDIEAEFELIQGAGLNTLRLFLRPQDLFLCDAVAPHVENFERLDSIIQLANDYNFHLIMVLNQDVIPSVLYFEEFVSAQMQFIVERYQDEGAILAWDVRDKGDVDYREGLIRQDYALRWLADTLVMVRQIDNQHPVTAGYWQDSLVTAPLVDFVSFQFYGEYADLRQEIANLKASANRPILLTGIGYSTFSVSDVTQRNLLFQAFEEVEQNALMGWMVNHAFDYPRTVTCIPPDCPGNGSELNQYGLWNTGYFPKLAVEAVRIATGVDE